MMESTADLSFEELKAELESLKSQCQKYKQKYRTTRSKNQELREENEKISEELEKKEKEVKTLQTRQLSKSSPDSKESVNQYDLVVRIDSLLFCNQRGWEVLHKSAENIEKWSKVDQIAVGVIGRENLGKTWIVNKLCKESFPSGFYFRTEGLSVKYSHEEKKKLKVILDSAGMNSAIFFYNQHQKQKYRDHCKLSESEDDCRVKELMINDRSLTEYFIQNFILYSCNVILVVVELLTQHDQKIIERIRNLYNNLKEIIVIHNFFKLDSKSQVLSRANEEITGAFDVTDRKIPGSDVPYYIEHSNNKDKKNIVHLILGREGCESGDFFNEHSLRHISDILDVETGINKFNVLEQLNKFFIEKSGIYFDGLTHLKEMPKFKETHHNNRCYYKLEYDDGVLKIKPAAFNVLGSLKDFDLNYQVFESVKGGKREKIFYFELPGVTEKPKLILKKDGKEKKDQILTLFISHELEYPKNFKMVQGENHFLKFEKKIRIDDEFGEYECDKSFTEISNGILKMKFILKEDQTL